MIYSHYTRYLKTLLLSILWISGLAPAVGQDYAITKLKLFPDRDEVLIKDVTADSLGFIWFLTNGEIYRYDGYRSLDILKTIADQQLTDDMPQRILIDQQNRLWMAGNTTLNYLDLKTWKVHPAGTDQLPAVQDRSVYWMKNVNDSTVIVAYENGHLLLIENDRVTRVDELYNRGLISNKVFPRCATWWNGKYWIGTTAGTLFSIDPKNKYAIDYHLLPGVSGVIMSMIAQRDGLILNVHEQGVFRFDFDSRPEKLTIDGFEISPDKLSVLAEGRELHIYADEESACLLDINLRVIQRLAIPSVHKFRTASVCIVNDQVWLGNDEGVFVIYPKTKGLSQLIPANPGANKSTRGIYIYPDGAAFYGTYDGAGYIDPDGSTHTFQDLRHDYAVLPMDDNNLLIGTEGGFLKVFDRKQLRINNLVYTLSDVAQRLHAFNLPDYVMCLAQTDSDYLIGSTNGLWKLAKESHQLSRINATANGTQLSDLHIRHIRLNGDGLMMLSTNLGLYGLQDGKLFKHYPQSGNLGVYKSVLVGDTLWLATQGKGLVAVDFGGRILQTFTIKEGLSNNLIYSLEYTDGILVVGTADGLNLIRGGEIRNIGMAEGLSQSEFNSGASYLDPVRKRVYVGGLMGYTLLDMAQRWFDDSSTQLESYVTEVHLSKGRTGERSADFTWPYRGKQTLELKPGQSLTGLYLGTPGNCRASGKIKYTLNGGEWEQLERGQFISLIAPSPGEYHIGVETHSTGPEPRKNGIIIVKQPYYYETWWFKALVILSGMGLLLLWYRSRLEKIRREQAIRNRIAADLHDEVGSSLTRIFFQATTLTAMRPSDDKDDRKLRLIADTSKQALATMSDMVWSIDSRFDTMKDLVIRMKDYAYRLREELEFRYRFEEQGDIESAKISQAVRQNLLLIFKEALINAVKYGDGSEIIIKLHMGSAIQLAVLNNYLGKQVAVGNRQGGRGLENMELRAEKVGGTLKVTDTGDMFGVVFELLPKRGM